MLTTSHIKYINIFMSLIIYIPAIAIIYYIGMKFYRYIWPAAERPQVRLPGGNWNALWNTIKHFFMKVLIKFFGFFITIWEWVSNNYFRLGILMSFLLYLGISYGYTIGGFKNKTEGKFLMAANIGWVILGVGLALSLFNAFLTARHNKNPYPATAKFKEKAKWTFWKTFFDFEVLIGFVVLFALILLTIFLLARYKIVTDSLASLVQLFVVIGLLFAAYRWINRHPKLKEILEDNLILKLLYHIIFLIPCFIISSAKYLYKDLKATPGVVWTVLAIEIIVVMIYFVIPLLMKYFFTTNIWKQNSELTVSQAMNGLDASIYSLQQSIKKIKKGLDVDWDAILKNGTYKPDQDDILTDYLNAHGFTDAASSQNNIKILLFGVPPTFAAAKSYIQANGLILQTKEDDLVKLIQERDALEPQIKKAFTTKLLLKEAVFTDIQKNLGNFEDLLNGIKTYNYQYGLSTWIFIHEQPPNIRAANNKFTSIVNYGDRPNILFNVSKNTLQIRMKNSENQDQIIYETDKIKLQKWNNLVINYDGGTLDIFINGKLVISKPNIVPFMSYEKITVGEDNGVSGGACNIVYFSSPLSKSQIDLFYNTLKHKNPPTV